MLPLQKGNTLDTRKITYYGTCQSQVLELFPLPPSFLLFIFMEKYTRVLEELAV